MNKKGRYIISIAVIVLILTTVGALAQTGVNGSGWWSTITVQNTDGAVADVTASMTGYEKHGTAGEYDCGSRDLIGFGSGAIFYPHWDLDPNGANCEDDVSFPSSFEGSSILSADGDIRAVSQVSNISDSSISAPGDTPYGRATGAYVGSVAPSTTIFYPIYKNDHSNEMDTFYIQNAGSGPTNITGVFKPCSTCLGAGNVYSYTVASVSPGKMVVIDASLASGPAGTIPAGDYSFGGVTFTSDSQPIAGAVLEHSQDASPAIYVKSTRLFNSSEADTSFFVPAVKYKWPDGNITPGTTNNRNKWSGVGIYNADSVQVTAVMTVTLTGQKEMLHTVM